MGAARKARALCQLLAVWLLACLGACGRTAAGEAAETPVPALPARTPTPYDVTAEDAAPAPAVTDGLEGAYYNDYLRQLLTLDGLGGATLKEGERELEGSYTRSGDTLTLSLKNTTETAVIDGDGDLTIEGRRGYFFRDWEFWGITAEEAGAEARPVYTEGIVDNGDGTFRCRDLTNGIACTFPEGMRLLPGELLSAVTLTDDWDGYVSGRNVTEMFYTSTGTPDEFLEDYVRTFVFGDFRQLYGTLISYDRLTLLHEDIDGRLAAATVRMNCAKGVVSVRSILYTSTYSDGTVNYICKTVFAPGTLAQRMETLAGAVTDMGAVRLMQTEEG